MSKYNYDKSALKGIGVGPFLNEVKTRTKEIEKGALSIPSSWYNPNELSKRLHPSVQHCIISDIQEHKDAKSFTLIPDPDSSTDEMAYFRAGQYVSVLIPTEEGWYRRPYTIASSPKNALGKTNTSYTLTIKRTLPGFASWKALDEWKVGGKIDLSGPLGEFYYESLRDPDTIIAIAGGSGITPFLSMAGAVADGIEDFRLIILYGSKTEDDILLKDELEDIVSRSKGKVQVVHVLSNEQKEGYEHGLIDRALIEKYAPKDDFAIWMCGPKPMYDFARTQIEAMGLPKRRWRQEVGGDYKNVSSHPGFPSKCVDQNVEMTVFIHGKKQTIPAKSDESILWALERNGIKAPNHCRSGECGWCHSRLISGDVFCPEEIDGRRLGDKKFGWIHTCAAYPLTDIEIEVFPENPNA